MNVLLRLFVICFYFVLVADGNACDPQLRASKENPIADQFVIINLIKNEANIKWRVFDAGWTDIETADQTAKFFGIVYGKNPSCMVKLMTVGDISVQELRNAIQKIFQMGIKRFLLNDLIWCSKYDSENVELRGKK